MMKHTLITLELLSLISASCTDTSSRSSNSEVVEIAKAAPPVTDEQLSDALQKSDDFGRYRELMIRAGKELYEAESCNLDDYKEHGGFVRAPSGKGQAGEIVYFVYCGNRSHVSGRYYAAINPKAKKVRIFQ